MKRDEQIRRDVLEELEWDGHVDATGIGVAVEAGVVTLTGSVSSHAERLAAQEAAHRVGGALDVANDIVVKLPGSPARTDTEVAHAVRYALEWDVFVPSDRIRSTVSHGVVTLEGEVDTRRQRDDAERAVRNLHGVRRIVNNIAVVAPPGAPRQVEEAIKKALERHALRDAGRIEVTVQDGAAILRGRVHSWSEKRAVLGAAGHAPGVRTVHDHLRVEP